MISVSSQLLLSIAPGNCTGARKAKQATITTGVAPELQTRMEAAEISTVLRAAHFLAQLCEESDGFCTTEEYATGAAYEGRKDLGNTQPGDGVRYKGRGLIEITGRYNYTLYGKLLGLDLVDHPELAEVPANSASIATAFWTYHALNALADKDDIRDITLKINGGLNGLLNRQLYLARAKHALTAPEPAPVA
jgi:putative chitinase